jgi:YesN/AraC family two-component response regulator
MNKPEVDNNVNQTRITTVQNYISQHYREDLTLSKLADVVNMAPTSLCHIYNRYTGQRISDLITETRIQNAKDMLLNTELTVKYIAYECGYSTLTNFNRHFKKLTGYTPTKYRELHPTKKI